MISKERKQNYVRALRNHSAISRNIQSYKLPIIVRPNIKSGKLKANYVPKVEYDYGLELDILSNSNTKYEKCELHNTKKYHYNNKWYSYRTSTNDHKYTFGILKVSNLPFKSFESKINKTSFFCSMNRMVYEGYIEPFMLFINDEFVNWNCIDIIYDCDESYIILHGSKYNYFNLINAKLEIVILPFGIEYFGEEPDDIWEMNYSMFSLYIKNSLTIENDKIIISVPKLNTTFEYKGMVYSIGFWLYDQLKSIKLNKLSEDRINKLRNINISKDIYYNDALKNYNVRFNAIDRDSYDNYIYTNMCHCSNYEYYTDNALFRFNQDGVLSNDGTSIITLINNNIKFIDLSSNEDTMCISFSDINTILFRENYLVFRNGKIDTDCKILLSTGNSIRIDNPCNDRIRVFALYYPDQKFITLSDQFSSKYLKDKGLEYLKSFKAKSMQLITSNGKTLDFTKYINTIKQVITTYTPENQIKIIYENTCKFKDAIVQYLKMLECDYYNNYFYNENVDNIISDIINFNPILLNKINDNDITSKVIYGGVINTLLYINEVESGTRGLKIPRINTYSNNEIYIMVFINGELLEEYCNMVVYANYFFIPIERSFSNGDKIEILYFNKCNNNEIHFDINLNMVGKFKKSDKYLKFRQVSLFERYIKPKDLKIFAEYPTKLIEYPTLVKKNNNIAFKVSENDDEDNVYIYKDCVEDLDSVEFLDDLHALDNKTGELLYDHLDYNALTNDPHISNNNVSVKSVILPNCTAVSSRKFIYQRIYSDKRYYRIQLDKRFKYCDDQGQYMLFINGRRMDDDTFLITVPKYTRPFWDRYLYISRFVNPTDRVELFYVPRRLLNINTSNTPITYNEDGYASINRSNLNIPFDNYNYLYFVNGKKIATDDIIPIDSNTIKINTDTKSLDHFVANIIYDDYIDQVRDYMHSNNLSKYDNIIRLIKLLDTDNDELNNVFNSYIRISSLESNIIDPNVDRIAIINEIIRDFWVSSGYNYNDHTYTYDYEEDKFITKDGETFILPSLDANPIINIRKNDIRYLYFSPDVGPIVEIGRELNSLLISWEYSTDIFGDEADVHSQVLNGTILDKDDRSFLYNTKVNEGDKFTIKTTLHNKNELETSFIMHFYNGIYYGNIDEDSLQWYNRKDELPDDIINHPINSNSENLGFIMDPKSNTLIFTDSSHLPTVFKSLTKVLKNTPDIKLYDYILGSNTYFVYAAPKRLVYNEDGSLAINFTVPDIHSREIIDYGKDDHTTPIYTNGEFDDQNCLIKLDKFEMNIIDEFEYTNMYGYTETYVVWKSNGFFTRAYDDYKFKITVNNNINDYGLT